MNKYENYNGVIEDTRSQEEKDKDFIHEELFLGLPNPIWEEREAKKFPIRNQDGSGACVAFATAKLLGIDEVYEGRPYVELSPRSIYVLRANKAIGDGMGMYLPNALDIARLYGACLESDVPSDDKGETAINVTSDITPEMREKGKMYRTKGQVQLPIDIDYIADITTKGKGVLLGFRFDYDEWKDRPVVNPNSKQSCGHGVAGVDNRLIKGEKIITMDDSWGPHFAKFGQRDIDKNFLINRCFYAGYTLNLIYEEEPVDILKPKCNFKFSMKRGDRNKDVVILQDILKYEGLFPKNVDSTGLFGPTTQRAVIKLQEKYASEILTPVGLKKGTGFVGSQTIKFLNKKYA